VSVRQVLTGLKADT